MTISKKLDKLYMDKEYYENRIDDLYERLNVVFNEVRRERIYELVNAFEEKLSGIMSEIEELEIEEEQAV
nr:MAG TPA: TRANSCRIPTION FACTOR E2F-4 DP-2/DNA TERNARY, DP, WINGED-HELIX, DNA-BINDING DOMAIN.6A [Caudoviricetes sp.]